MAQREIEVILLRQLASHLATPVFLVDPTGALIFYNEPAERILGLRFEETGEMRPGEWATMFTPTADDGSPLSIDAQPLGVALAKKRASHLAFWIKGLDGARRRIEATAFPIISSHEAQFLGAVAFFWESGR